MWLATKGGFVSAVEVQRSGDKHDGMIVVRSREKSALVNLFGLTAKGAKMAIVETKPPDRTDYRFRMFVEREVLHAALDRAVDGIDYPNFKDAVFAEAKAGRVSFAYEKALHSVWSIFGRLQKGGPYGWDARPARPKRRRGRAAPQQHGLSLDDEFRAWVEGDVGVDPDSLTSREQTDLASEWAARADADPLDPRFG